MIRNAAKLFILFILPLILLHVGHAQDGKVDLRIAPPPIEFGQWTLLTELPDAVSYRMSFPSAIPSGFAENDTVPLHVTVPNAPGPYPVCVILHYWGATDLKSENSLAQTLVRRGIASVIVELPYHLGRSPAGTKSGEMAVLPDPVKLKVTMAQAVSDVRRAVDWIVSRKEFDAQKIGLCGTSLGGIVGTAVFAVEPRIAAFCPILGGIDIADVIWSSSILVKGRDDLRRQGWTKATLRDALVDVEPGNYLSSEESRPVYLIAARYDTVVTPRAYDALIDKLPKAKVLWLDTGHYGGFFVERRVFGSAAQFFSKALQGEEFVPPDRIYAPTVRLCAIYDTERQLQIGAGFDIWRSNAEGTIFGAAILTPKGVQGYIGTKITGGFSVGITVLPRKAVPGLLWSFIL